MSDRARDPQAPKRTAWYGTLFGVRASDARERAAQPAERAHGRAARRAEETSDVRRFRGVVAAAVAAAAGVAGAALLFPPPGGFSSPGPLARPHERAHLACSSCHASGADRSSARTACVGCHGPHPSTRAGHRHLAETGALGCPSCHRIHERDQGVSFAPDQPPTRFAPGLEAPAPDVGFVPTRATTVPIVSVASCSRCHDPGAARDPIARCLLSGQDSLGGDRPVACFDEHQQALPAGASTPSNRARPTAPGTGPGASGVCAGQHTQDRAVAWDAARAVAARMPVLRADRRTGSAWAWLLGGLGSAALAFVAVRGSARVRLRRAQRSEAARVIPKAPDRVRLPRIDVSTCLGCYACVDACPYGVLEVERYVALVARPEACCGLTLCEQRCPNGSLVVTDGDIIGDRPRLADDLESLDVRGLYLAGDVSGLPLIKNAIAQGAHAATSAADSLRAGARSREGILDLLIVGAGPAGISAALRAKEIGLSFEVLEQANVAQSIRSFPRGKLIFDQPLELPVTGKLWLKETTKEELLFQWLRVVRQERLPIREERRVIGARRDDSFDGFVVTSAAREGGGETTHRARRLIVAIGGRGSPRRLPFDLAPELEAKVHYSLADARSFEGKRVLIVGLGDVAMESALALARQPGTEVTLCYRGGAFRRGKARNIEEIRRAVQAGRVGIRWSSEVAGIAAETVTIAEAGRTSTLQNDAVFVMIGSIAPWSMLRALGIRSVAESPAEIPSASRP